jgi:hypothetical protein
MPKYKAEPGTEVNGVDHQGNVWPKPFVFGKDGTLSVPDDQQDVVSALESAADAGAIKRVKEPARSPNEKE